MCIFSICIILEKSILKFFWMPSTQEVYISGDYGLYGLSNTGLLQTIWKVPHKARNSPMGLTTQ